MATQIRTRQIADGAVTNVKVAAGAGIVTSKLADGSLFIKSDGSVAMAADLSIGNSRITNLGTPSSGTDATTKNYVDTLFDQLPSLFKFKGSARAVATGNVTLSNPGTASFDSITLSSGDILGLINQTAAEENGLYTFNGSGSALTRIASMNHWDEVPGAMFTVEEGATYASRLYLCTSADGGTINVSAINFLLINGSGLQNSNFVDAEVPSGTIDGANATYTLANTPVVGSVKVYLNGVRQRAGGNDYSISGTTITMVTAPLTGEYIEVEYRK